MPIPKLFAFALLAAIAAFSGCTTNPTTGRSQYLSMSRDEEIKLGSEATPGLTQEYGGKVNDVQLQQYISNIGHKLAAVTEADNPSLPWEFTFLDSPVINAFALPGGKVFISRGLAEEMTNEAQMAAVLGHEIGHVTAKHSNERYGQAIGTSIGGAILGGVIGAVVTGDASGAGIGAGAGASVGGIAALSFSRDQEIEADRLGMRYMEKLKYDPSAAVEVQEILGRASAAGGDAPPEILATHPSSATRIAELNKRLDKYYQHTRNNPEFQKHDARFRSEFLSRLNSLPKPRKADAGEHGASSREMMVLASLGDPALWCAHCREAATKSP